MPFHAVSCGFMGSVVTRPGAPCGKVSRFSECSVTPDTLDSSTRPGYREEAATNRVHAPLRVDLPVDTDSDDCQHPNSSLQHITANLVKVGDGMCMR